jgi:hypothetical protein
MNLPFSSHMSIGKGAGALCTSESLFDLVDGKIDETLSSEEVGLSLTNYCQLETLKSWICVCS